jgi:hypothetical protein
MDIEQIDHQPPIDAASPDPNEGFCLRGGVTDFLAQTRRILTGRALLTFLSSTPAVPRPVTWHLRIWRKEEDKAEGTVKIFLTLTAVFHGAIGAAS